MVFFQCGLIFVQLERWSGLTSSHPLSKLSLEILGRPNAMQLMEITACIGLAQNFGALRSLVTSGIQGAYENASVDILNQLNATEEEKRSSKRIFKDEAVSFNSTREFLEQKKLINLNHGEVVE